MKSVRLGLIVVSLGLCALVVVQWTRESALRTILAGMDVRLKSAGADASDLADKVRTYEGEIRRLTGLQETSAIKATERQREVGRLTALLTERDAAAALPEDFVETMKARNAEVARQNGAITKQNAALRELVRERDDLTGRLNARTREFNELTAKYNKLMK